MNPGQTTTAADSRISTEKYCAICQKTCGHWTHEHDLVFDGEKNISEDGKTKEGETMIGEKINYYDTDEYRDSMGYKRESQVNAEKQEKKNKRMQYVLGIFSKRGDFVPASKRLADVRKVVNFEEGEIGSIRGIKIILKEQEE